MALIRLQKYLSEKGVCSRRQGETYIVAGHVKVNGNIVTELGTKIDSETDRIEFNGRQLSSEEKKIYIALNKPKGYVSSCMQDDTCIVLDLVDIKARVYPVGRLDKDSTGLLILTNDGRLHHRLLHPSFSHEREYEVTLSAPLPNKALKNMEKGLPMMGTKTLPSKISVISPTIFKIVLKEGKNRQIRRMVRKVGGHVKELNRIRIVNITLEKLGPGQWRYLSEKELHCLFKHLDLT